MRCRLGGSLCLTSGLAGICLRRAKHGQLMCLGVANGNRCCRQNPTLSHTCRSDMGASEPSSGVYKCGEVGLHTHASTSLCLQTMLLNCNGACTLTQGIHLKLPGPVAYPHCKHYCVKTRLYCLITIWPICHLQLTLSKPCCSSMARRSGVLLAVHQQKSRHIHTCIQHSRSQASVAPTKIGHAPSC